MCFRPAEIAMKKCSQCGATNKPVATECEKCGAPLDTEKTGFDADQPMTPGPSAPAAPGAPKPPSAPKPPQ